MPDIQAGEFQDHIEEIVSAILILLAKIRALGGSYSGYIENGRDQTDPNRVAAARHYRKQRERRSVICEDMFADPAWDILIDLYIAGAEGKLIAVTSACVGLGVPVSTAWRWLNRMEERGLIAKSPDPCDGRRLLVCLTPKSHAKVLAWLKSTYP